MRSRSFIIGSLLLTLGASAAGAASSATQPSQPDNGWTGQFFEYPKLHPLIVEQRTPTAAQLDYHVRPPQLDSAAPKLVPAAEARPAIVGATAVVHLLFRDSMGNNVPVLLCTPRNKTGPYPLVVAVHGLTSNKAQMCTQVAQQFAAAGFAVLAPDLPMHGERPGDPRALIDRQNPLKSIDPLDEAVLDIKQCIDMAKMRPELDTHHGVILVGYSLGSLIDSVVGADDPRVRAMCLMVGGTPEFPPALGLIPQFAALQPQLAIVHFAGRPLLMLNGLDDQTITPEMGQRLYDAAEEPKQQIWFKSGHHLPPDAYQEAADWVAKTWKTLTANEK